MKCYRVDCGYFREYNSAVYVYAKSAAQAKNIAYPEFDYSPPYTSLRAKRMPMLDKYYIEGYDVMYWEIPEYKRALLKECGYHCIDPEPEECRCCMNNDVCDYWYEYNTYVKPKEK